MKLGGKLRGRQGGFLRWLLSETSLVSLAEAQGEG